jgi:hypothetical protein
MLTDGLSYLFDGYWWMVYPPAIILIITVIAFNLIGEAIPDSLDVRLRWHDRLPESPRRWLPGLPRRVDGEEL